MIDDLGTWLAIVGVALSAIVARTSFVVFGARLKLPVAVEHALRFAPAAALADILAPALILRAGHVDFSLANHRLIAAIAAAMVIWRTKSMLWTIFAGMIVLTALRLYA